MRLSPNYFLLFSRLVFPFCAECTIIDIAWLGEFNFARFFSLGRHLYKTEVNLIFSRQGRVGKVEEGTQEEAGGGGGGKLLRKLN